MTSNSQSNQMTVVVFINGTAPFKFHKVSNLRKLHNWLHREKGGYHHVNVYRRGVYQGRVYGDWGPLQVPEKM